MTVKHISYIEDFTKWKEEFSFSTEISIRFSETDMFGHVNNVSAFIYFEQARIEFFKSIGLFTKLEEDTIPVVADLQCDYHNQLFFGETIKIFVKANLIKNSTLDVHYMAVKPDGKICLTGRGNIVNVDTSTGKAVSLTNEQLQKLQK